MIDQADRDRLREALAEWDAERDLDDSLIDITPLVETARLVAERPNFLYAAAAEGIAANDTMTDPRYWARVARNAVDAALDALLAQQTGDTK